MMIECPYLRDVADKKSEFLNLVGSYSRQSGLPPRHSLTGEHVGGTFISFAATHETPFDETESTIDEEDIRVPEPTIRASNERLMLFMRKQADRATNEDLARLELLTAKMRKLSPRVTKEDVDRVEEVANTIVAVDDKIQQLRAKYGLK